MAIFQVDLGYRYQNVAILDFIGAKDVEVVVTTVQSSGQNDTQQPTPIFYRPDDLTVTQPTVSKH